MGKAEFFCFRGCCDVRHVRPTCTFATSPQLATDLTATASKNYTCSQTCHGNRIPVAGTNDILWNALVQLLIQPERVHSMIAPTPGDRHPEVVKKDLVVLEREEKTTKENSNDDSTCTLKATSHRQAMC